MIPVLAYEVPLFAEARFQSPALRKGMAALAAVLAAVGLAIPLLLHRRLGWTGALSLSIGPMIGVAVVVLCGALHGDAVVFADRLEASLRWAGVRVWRRRVPWPDVVRCDVRHKRPGDGSGYKVLGLGTGLTVVMFGGDGVSLHLKGHAELLIGSTDPDRLSAAIEAARSAEPAAEPPGSVADH